MRSKFIFAIIGAFIFLNLTLASCDDSKVLVGQWEAMQKSSNSNGDSVPANINIPDSEVWEFTSSGDFISYGKLNGKWYKFDIEVIKGESEGDMEYTAKAINKTSGTIEIHGNNAYQTNQLSYSVDGDILDIDGVKFKRVKGIKSEGTFPVEKD